MTLSYDGDLKMPKVNWSVNRLICGVVKLTKISKLDACRLSHLTTVLYCTCRRRRDEDLFGC